MKVALALLTCNRPDITRKTVASLKKHLDLSRFELLHADDCSDTNENIEIARAAGFKELYRTEQRQGVASMWRNTILRAAAMKCDWILIQENDWEWVRDFPWAALEKVNADKRIYTMRLYGEFRERGRKRPCNPMHMSKFKKTNWKPSQYEGFNIGDAHWGFACNLIRTADALFLTGGIKNEGDARRRCKLIDKLSVRPQENFVFHIGEDRTQGFIA